MLAALALLLASQAIVHMAFLVWFWQLLRADRAEPAEPITPLPTISPESDLHPAWRDTESHL